MKKIHLILLIAAIILILNIIYDHFREPNEKYIDEYFEKLAEFDNSISDKDIDFYYKFIKESSYVEPIHRGQKGSPYRILNDGDDPYRHVDVKVDHEIEELRLIFMVKGEKQLDAFIDMCEHVNIRKVDYAKSNKRLGIAWPAALYQDKYWRFVTRAQHDSRYSRELKYFIYWCSDINSYFAHDLSFNDPNINAQVYLWHRVGILSNSSG